MVFKNKLKDFRLTLGLSQIELAEKIDYTVSLYEKVESGRVNASSNFMHAFKKAFPTANIDDIFFSSNSDKIANLQLHYRYD